MPPRPRNFPALGRIALVHTAPHLFMIQVTEKGGRVEQTSAPPPTPTLQSNQEEQTYEEPPVAGSSRIRDLAK